MANLNLEHVSLTVQERADLASAAETLPTDWAVTLVANPAIHRIDVKVVGSRPGQGGLLFSKTFLTEDIRSIVAYLEDIQVSSIGRARR